MYLQTFIYTHFQMRISTNQLFPVWLPTQNKPNFNFQSQNFVLLRNERFWRKWDSCSFAQGSNPTDNAPVRELHLPQASHQPLVIHPRICYIGG